LKFLEDLVEKKNENVKKICEVFEFLLQNKDPSIGLKALTAFEKMVSYKPNSNFFINKIWIDILGNRK
jgi:hypothetical protein